MTQVRGIVIMQIGIDQPKVKYSWMLLEQSTEDANGYSYPMSAAFSPLYFTKITIPDSKQLALQDEKELRKDVVLHWIIWQRIV